MDFEPRGSSRFSPCPKRLQTPPPLGHKHPHAILFQDRGPCDNLSNKGLDPSEAMQIFLRGIQALPNDILRSCVCEKYASTERSRLRLLLATWDIEATRRKLRTLERIQHNLEKAHSLSESEYKFWLDMYSKRGLPDLKEDEMFYNSQIHSAAQEAEREAAELSAMVEQATKRGLDVESFDDELEANVSDWDLELGAGTSE